MSACTNLKSVSDSVFDSVFDSVSDSVACLLPTKHQQTLDSHYNEESDSEEEDWVGECVECHLDIFKHEAHVPAANGDHVDTYIHASCVKEMNFGVCAKCERYFGPSQQFGPSNTCSFCRPVSFPSAMIYRGQY